MRVMTLSEEQKNENKVKERQELIQLKRMNTSISSLQNPFLGADIEWESLLKVMSV